MAFSFNWAGLTAPRVDPIKDEVDMNRVGENLGKGLRGYRTREGWKEYADMIRGAQGAPSEIADIEAEIARLQDRNAELQALMDRDQAIANAQAGMAGYNPAGQVAAAQMQPYLEHMHGLETQGIQGGNMYAAQNAQNYRTR